MKKVLKFSRFNTKRRMIQYSLISVVLILLSFYTFYTGKRLLNERRVRLIEEYSQEVSQLKDDKAHNLRRIEAEYDEKISRLQGKIDELQEKVDR